MGEKRERESNIGFWWGENTKERDTDGQITIK
jgi:hypothetical protein